MNTLFFLAMLCGITGLAIWAALPRPWQGGGWLPFDMREPQQKAPVETAVRRSRTVARREPVHPRKPR
jgi:hypothetical protein